MLGARHLGDAARLEATEVRVALLLSIWIDGALELESSDSRYSSGVVVSLGESQSLIRSMRSLALPLLIADFLVSTNDNVD